MKNVLTTSRVYSFSISDIFSSDLIEGYPAVELSTQGCVG